MLFLLASGVGHVADLAKLLGLQPNTVHNHLKGIFRRSGTRSKSELLSALLLHAIERDERSARPTRRAAVLLLDACRALAEPLAGLGLRVHEGCSDRPELGPDGRIDVAVAPWEGPTQADALAERLRARFGVGVELLHTASQDTNGEPSRDGGHPLPLQPGRLAFEILLRLADGPYERSRLLRVDRELPAQVDLRLETRLANIGFGGAFVVLPTEALTGPNALRVGARVELALSLPDERPIQTRATVVWTRTNGRIASPAGVGVQFMGVAGADQMRLEEFVRLQRMAGLPAPAARARRLVALT